MIFDTHLLELCYQRTIIGITRNDYVARPDMKQDAKTFITALRKLDRSAGNGALRRALDWKEPRYWKVHAALVETGKVLKGRGPGGSVALP
jgi:hypothetical protein